MSYGMNDPCYNCEKFKNDNPCTDRKNIEEAIAKIHSTKVEDGHKGSGMILLMCTKVKPIHE